MGHQHTDGKPVFVGLASAGAESGDAWAGFLTDLGDRGLACPLLVVSDGAAGLVGAVDRTMGAALRQRCPPPELSQPAATFIKERSPAWPFTPHLRRGPPGPANSFAPRPHPAAQQ